MGWLTRARESLAKAIAPKPEERIVNLVQTSVPMFGGRYKQPDFDIKRLVDEGYRRNVVVYCCINEIAGSASELPIVVRDKETKEPVSEDHPLSRLFRDPHTDSSKFELWERELIDLQSSGQAYLHRGKNAMGQTIQLKRLRPDRMKVVPDPKTGSILGWDYFANESTTRGQFLPREDVVPFTLPDPMNDYYGLPPILICAAFGDLEWEMAIHMLAYFRNGGVPAGVLNVEGAAIDATERERIMQEWNDTFGRLNKRFGESGAFKLAVLSGAKTTYEKIGNSPDEIRMDGLWDVSESRICATFKVPPVRVQVRLGLMFSTYSNYQESGKAFWQETLLPMYSRLDERLTADFADELEDGKLEIVFDSSHVEALKEGIDAKVERATKLYGAGIITLHEAREMIDAEDKSGAEAVEGSEPDADTIPDLIVVPTNAKGVKDVQLAMDTKAAAAQALLDAGGVLPDGQAVPGGPKPPVPPKPGDKTAPPVPPKGDKPAAKPAPFPPKDKEKQFVVRYDDAGMVLEVQAGDIVRRAVRDKTGALVRVEQMESAS